MLNRTKIYSYYDRKNDKKVIDVINKKINMNTLNKLLNLFQYNRLIIVTEIDNNIEFLRKLDQLDIEYDVEYHSAAELYIETS